MFDEGKLKSIERGLLATVLYFPPSKITVGGQGSQTVKNEGSMLNGAAGDQQESGRIGFRN